LKSIIYVILEISFRHKLLAFWFLIHSFKKKSKTHFAHKRNAVVTRHSDLKKTTETPKDASVQKQPSTWKPLQTSCFLFLLKAYPFENKQYSKKLSDSTFYFDLVVWGSHGKCGKDVSFNLCDFIFLLPWCQIQQSLWLSEKNLTPRHLCLFFSSTTIHEYIQQIFHLCIRLWVSHQGYKDE